MLSKYLSITGIILAVMVGLDYVLFGVIDLLWGVGVLLALVYLLALRYRAKFSQGIKIGVGIIMCIISIVTNLIFILLVVLIFANLPKGKPFETKVVVKPAPEAEVAAYKRWIDMDSRGSKALKEECFSLPVGWKDNLFDYTLPGMDKLLSSECEAERAKLLSFHAKNICSIPLFQYKNEYCAPIDIEIPNISHLINMYKIELTDVARRLDKGDVEGAKQKYIWLWQAAKNQLSSKINTLIQTAVSIAEVDLLTEFYSRYGDKLQLEHNKELINIVQATISKMDRAMAGSLVGEYALVKGIILKILYEKEDFSVIITPETTTSMMERLIEKRLLKWPFYDGYKSWKMIDEFWYETIELSRKPLYKTEEEWQRYDKKFEELTTPSLSCLENPVGNILNAIAMPRLGRDFLIDRKEVKKAQATAVLYLLSVTDPNNPDEIPIDNLTGKRFRVVFQNDTLEIQSEHKEYKDKVHYKVKRKSL